MSQNSITMADLRGEVILCCYFWCVFLILVLWCWCGCCFCLWLLLLLFIVYCSRLSLCVDVHCCCFCCLVVFEVVYVAIMANTIVFFCIVDTICFLVSDIAFVIVIAVAVVDLEMRLILIM
mgnify:CR=1 FL=1